jgi:phosphate transport system protein
MWKELKALWSADDLLNEAWDMSYEAIKLDKEMFEEAVESLWGIKTKKTQKLIFKKDKLINKYERDIRRKVVTHISVQGGSSIAHGIVLSTVIIDIERIGDYVKNIVELAEMHPDELKAVKIKLVLNDIESKINKLFLDIPECLETGNEDLALDLYTSTKDVGRICDDNIELIVRGKQPELDVQSATVLVLYFRYLKRINAHLLNIVSSVINPFDRIGYAPKQIKER